MKAKGIGILLCVLIAIVSAIFLTLGLFGQSYDEFEQYESYRRYKSRVAEIYESESFRERTSIMSSEERMAFEEEMVNSGFLTLSDDELILRAHIIRQLTFQGPITLCAGMIQSNIRTHEFFESLDKLSEFDQGLYIELFEKAVYNNLNNVPQKLVDRQEATDAYVELLSLVPEEEQERFKVNMNTILNLKEAIDITEACWTQKVLYTELEKLPKATQSVLLRLFIS